jgi:tetratricopeptide (TPR) repeat protein
MRTAGSIADGHPGACGGSPGAPCTSGDWLASTCRLNFKPGGSGTAAVFRLPGGLPMIDALFDLFGTFYQAGNFLQAERIARNILQAIPDDLVSLQFIGLVYYRTGRREEAIEAFNAAACGGLDDGTHLRVDSRLRASAQCLRAARVPGSAVATAWYDLGLILLRLRRHQQAISAFQSALSGRPDFRAAQRAIARLSASSCRQSSPSANRKLPAAGRSLSADHPSGQGRNAAQPSGLRRAAFATH